MSVRSRALTAISPNLGQYAASYLVTKVTIYLAPTVSEKVLKELNSKAEEPRTESPTTERMTSNLVFV